MSPQEWGAIWEAPHGLWSAFEHPWVDTADGRTCGFQPQTETVKHFGQHFWILLRKIALLLERHWVLFVFFFSLPNLQRQGCLVWVFQIINQIIFCICFLLLFKKYKLNLRNAVCFGTVSHRPFQREENPSRWRGRWWKLMGPSSHVAWTTVSLLRDLQKTNPRRAGKADLHLHVSHTTGNGHAFTST